MPWRFARHAPEQEADVLDEAEVEHAIGFVEHDGFDRIEREHVCFEVVDEAARRGDDEIAAVLERLALLVVVHAADERRAAVSRPMFLKSVDLIASFARRRDDDGARIAELRSARAGA
jgi:hypothetical protein